MKQMQIGYWYMTRYQYGGDFGDDKFHIVFINKNDEIYVKTKNGAEYRLLSFWWLIMIVIWTNDDTIPVCFYASLGSIY